MVILYKSYTYISGIIWFVRIVIKYARQYVLKDTDFRWVPNQIRIIDQVILSFINDFDLFS